MSATLHHTIRSGPGFTFIKLDGVVNEDNNLASLSHEVHGQTLVLDLSGITRINSCGVRDWVNWLNRVSATGIRVVLIRCSPAIISQVNMVINFSGDAVIHSFFAPYFNPETEESSNTLLFTVDFANQNPVRAPAVTCPETGYAMEFDDFEESYFAFISGSPHAGRLDATTLAIVQSLTPENASASPAPMASHMPESAPQQAPYQEQFAHTPASHAPPSTHSPSQPSASPSFPHAHQASLSSTPANTSGSANYLTKTTQVPLEQWNDGGQLPPPVAISGRPLSAPGVHTPDSQMHASSAPGSYSASVSSQLPASSASRQYFGDDSMGGHQGSPSNPFISSPKEAAQAFPHPSGHSAPINSHDEGEGKTALILAGLGIALVLVFALLLWLAFR